uniref:Uncharacterized protein n=1 Tax=Rhizophora mucronata TaxID=61149 RepID=A0A2P2PHJ3_RHIMU
MFYSSLVMLMYLFSLLIYPGNIV